MKNARVLSTFFSRFCKIFRETDHGHAAIRQLFSMTMALEMPYAGYRIVSHVGKVVINNYANTIQQIETIAADDEMLRIEHLENNRDVLYIGEIGFGINIYKGELSLLSSTTAEDPKVQQQVVAYMNNLYGAPEECEPYNYLWRVSGEDGYFTIVSRLQRLHTEEGGTVLFFY